MCLCKYRNDIVIINDHWFLNRTRLRIPYQDSLIVNYGPSSMQFLHQKVFLLTCCCNSARICRLLSFLPKLQLFDDSSVDCRQFFDIFVIRQVWKSPFFSGVVARDEFRLLKDFDKMFATPTTSNCLLFDGKQEFVDKIEPDVDVGVDALLLEHRKFLESAEKLRRCWWKTSFVKSKIFWSETEPIQNKKCH